MSATQVPQFRSLLDFLVESPHEHHVDLVHAECNQVVAMMHTPVPLDDVVRLAADHECPE